ncbi:MAG TPA: hypothetical protein PKD53_08275 [Chloroflexaceae bacterium]|nr:hypothetical protein [Chloroflexaceae bacterium]
MNTSATPIPLACNPHALSAAEWSAHQATSARLFRELRVSSEELPDGYAFLFPVGAFALVAAFVDGERRCCPFLTFRIDVPPADASITLRITGSAEARAIIAAELPIS